MERHLLKLAQKARYNYTKYVTVEGKLYAFELWTYGNTSGFVHFAILYKESDEIANAKAQYYNRAWERYTGQSVFRECIGHALKSKDITLEDYTLLWEDLRENK